jgi:hypothetical protein
MLATIATIALGLAAVAAAQSPSTAVQGLDVTAEKTINAVSQPSLSTDWSTPRYLGEVPTSDGYQSVEAPEGWRFTIGVPLWLPAFNGDFTVKGVTFSADQQTNDVIDLVNEHLNFALALHFEAQKDRLGFFTDFMYVDVAADRDTVFGTTVEGTVKGFIGEAGMLYTLYSTTHADRFPLRVDALGGLRVTGAGLEIDTENFGSIDDSKILFDPFIGLRGEVGLVKWLSVKARGDIGGFDAFGDASSQLTWQAATAASFHFGKSCYLDAGYRWLSYDYDEGSGFDRFALDAILHGPYIELGFKF